MHLSRSSYHNVLASGVEVQLSSKENINFSYQDNYLVLLCREFTGCIVLTPGESLSRARVFYSSTCGSHLYDALLPVTDDADAGSDGTSPVRLEASISPLPETSAPPAVPASPRPVCLVNSSLYLAYCLSGWLPLSQGTFTMSQGLSVSAYGGDSVNGSVNGSINGGEAVMVSRAGN